MNEMDKTSAKFKVSLMFIFSLFLQAKKIITVISFTPLFKIIRKRTIVRESLFYDKDFSCKISSVLTIFQTSLAHVQNKNSETPADVAWKYGNQACAEKLQVSINDCALGTLN